MSSYRCRFCIVFHESNEVLKLHKLYMQKKHRSLPFHSSEFLILYNKGCIRYLLPHLNSQRLIQGFDQLWTLCKCVEHLLSSSCRTLEALKFGTPRNMYMFWEHTISPGSSLYLYRGISGTVFIKVWWSVKFGKLSSAVHSLEIHLHVSSPIIFPKSSRRQYSVWCTYSGNNVRGEFSWLKWKLGIAVTER